MTVNEKTRFDDLADNLLAWYHQHARELPWRIGPGQRQSGVTPDPYRVWLAEIMLQQTTVPHATRYYLEFTRRWPTIEALAAEKDDVVMAAWAGLGYYARARNLLKCAREVSKRGSWPDSETGLRELPGIGPYTAGAVAALAFGRKAAAIDGNVERVFARLTASKGDWKSEKAAIKPIVQSLVPEDRPAEFAEALMDLGAIICTPKSPNCLICPLSFLCMARAEGEPQRYPIKPKKTAKPHRQGHVYVLLDGQGGVETERRSESGLLGGMLGLPGSQWIEGEPPSPSFPIEADWERTGEVRHVFTHFSLALTVWTATFVGSKTNTTNILEAKTALPTVFKKALVQSIEAV